MPRLDKGSTSNWRDSSLSVRWSRNNGVLPPMATWIRALKVKTILWTKWWRINDAFGGNDAALKTFLVGMAVMSLGVKTWRDLRRWSI